MNALEFHPLADLFPLIEEEDFDRLADDIEANGLQESIVLLDGKILDGRNRYRALMARGSFKRHHTENYDSKLKTEAQALAWVLSKNLHRRHLSSSQRGLLAARLADMQAGRPSSQSTTPIGAISKKAAADLLNVGAGSVDRGKKVLASGTEELVEAVQKGDLSLGAAAEIATLPMEEQVKAIESADPKAFAKVAKARREDKTREKKQRRTEREAELGQKQLSLPDKKFGVIYADPEWKFQPYSETTGMDRAADNHYPTSSAQVILERPVQSICATDCVLFLWTTAPMLEDGLDVMGGWGFDYKSQFIWTKDKAGTGYWNRNTHEILLVGTKGNVPAPAPGTQWPSVIEAPVGAHSEKPDIFHQLIESYFPTLPKIELNARRARVGWMVWGLEAPDGAQSMLPKAPVAGEPIEFTVGGMKKGFEARFGVRAEPDGKFSIRLQIDFKTSGRSGPFYGSYDSLKDALSVGLSEIYSSLLAIKNRNDSVTTDAEKSNATNGLKWIANQAFEWGLSIGGDPVDSFAPPSGCSSPSPAPPPMGGKSKSRAKTKKPQPLNARVDIGELRLLVRFNEGRVKFYATQKRTLFPAEIGWVECEYEGEATEANATGLAKAAWKQHFRESSDWRVPTVVYTSGRTGPMPVKGGKAQ